jgi:hypothetical protein
MQPKKPKLTALWHALDEATFGSERTLNLRESLPSAAEARARAESWLRGRQVTRAREVLIITGRGNQSTGGIGVLRKEILAMMPSLRKRGIVESWREHSPGSVVVKLAPTSALFSAGKRRRDNRTETSTVSAGSISGLNSETAALLRQLALASLDALGVENAEAFVRDEMQRLFSILSGAIPQSERSEEALKASIRNAIEEGFDNGRDAR